MTADTIYDDFYNEWWRPNDDCVDYVDYDDREVVIIVITFRENRHITVRKTPPSGIIHKLCETILTVFFTI